MCVCECLGVWNLCMDRWMGGVDALTCMCMNGWMYRCMCKHMSGWICGCVYVHISMHVHVYFMYVLCVYVYVCM